MARKTEPKVKPDDPAQAERFAQAARELAAAGELSLTEADEAFELAFKKIVPEKRATKPHS
jgi:hypothetical protein